ncbi:MAG: RluA family pseudouridine synthase [Candidatus Rokubacteria bacterium]|nr:RluA family pseudouridine synthase [Candidatus Rokubacteria bacterium]
MAGGTADANVLARLRAMFPESSGRSLKQWLAQGRVRVDGEVVRDGRATVGPDRTVVLSPQGRVVFPSALRLVHEDDDLLVIDKPAGLLSIATQRERGRTVYRLVWDYLAAASPPRRPFIVHRLDRETSGLLVFAKSPRVKQHLQTQFEARTVERMYVAVVEGRVSEDRGRLSSWLTEDRGLRVRSRGGRRGRDAGRHAITDYRVLERRRDATVLELRLGTGRRQQIRVQLAELGHPVVGDLVHGSQQSPIRRLCLHAARLGFVHPATGAPARFESPPPAAFRRIGARA